MKNKFKKNIIYIYHFSSPTAWRADGLLCLTCVCVYGLSHISRPMTGGSSLVTINLSELDLWWIYFIPNYWCLISLCKQKYKYLYSNAWLHFKILLYCIFFLSNSVLGKSKRGVDFVFPLSQWKSQSQGSQPHQNLGWPQFRVITIQFSNSNLIWNK